jgi:pimeloyl-ACP methyl ester carboxylesterase
MTSRLNLSIASACLLTGLAVTAWPAASRAPTFEAGACPTTKTPIEALKNASCGVLVVPENRDKQDGPTIRLPVAIIPAQSKVAGAVPLVFMEGGPGGAALPSAASLVKAGLHEKRDVIIMGQRGTLYAQPSLICEPVDDANAKTNALPRNDKDSREIFLKAARTCRDHFVDRGVDIGAYNTTQSAQDFADLRKALGHPQWDVYGVSYGTDLALTYMLHHPEGVRSVTVDSVVPPNVASVGMNWTNAGNGLGNIFAACGLQPACHAHYPDPAGQLAKLMTKLQAEPETYKLKPVLIPGKKPEPDVEDVETLVDGAALINWLAGISEELGADLPRFIADMAEGKREQVAASIAAVSLLKGGEVSYGLQYGVVCTEWVPYQAPDDVIASGQRAFPKFPKDALQQAPQFPFAADICQLWDVPKGSATQRGIDRSGKIPTLVIAGTYDALTSTQTAEKLATEMKGATFLPVPGVGHFVVPKSKCAQEVMKSFLDNPKAPKLDCAAALKPPPFNVGPH